MSICQGRLRDSWGRMVTIPRYAKIPSGEAGPGGGGKELGLESCIDGKNDSAMA